MPLSTARRVLASVELPYLALWQRQSLITSRRNALHATTELRQQRREREEVEEFLQSLQRERRAAAIRMAAERRAGVARR